MNTLKKINRYLNDNNDDTAYKALESFLKDIQKDIPRALKEIDQRDIGGAKSITPSLIGKMVRVNDEKWYDHFWR